MYERQDVRASESKRWKAGSGLAVAETTAVDQVAEAPDGRVLLAMTEDRPYASSDTAVLVDDLRLKLNAYVYLIRSGQLAQMIGREPDRGVEIRLFCMDVSRTGFSGGSEETRRR